MTLVDPNVVRGYLAADDELPAALSWAQTNSIPCSWDEEELVLTIRLTAFDAEGGPEEYLLTGTFTEYRAFPPTWRFLDPRTGKDIGRAAYPHAGPFPEGSVLHSNGVICAPWNRLAYKDRGGPHSDWEDASAWQSTARDRTQADRVPDMLARIRAEVLLSPRRLAPFPALPAPEAI